LAGIETPAKHQITIKTKCLMKEIKRATRKRDGVTFRITDDLPNWGHYYTNEYAKTSGDFLMWYRHTPSKIETLEQAETMLEDLINN